MKTLKIATDFFMFRGGIEMTEAPPSYCNTYLLRDEDMLVLYDTSAFEDIRKEMLKVIKKYEDACSKFYLIIGHADPDHVLNNDVINDVKIREKHFLVHEAAFGGPYAGFLEGAKPLVDSERETVTIGDTTLQGWKLGNIYLIHDGSHVPEHLCLYDKKRKALLVGDLTLEANPMMNSKTSGLIEYCDKFSRMAEGDHIEIVGDGHRSRDAYEQAFQKYNVNHFTQLQTSDYIQGKDAIIEFFRGFSGYYREIRDTILDVHKNLGRATIEEIVGVLKKSDSQAVQMKLKLDAPRFLSWIEISVASILREAGISEENKGE